MCSRRFHRQWRLQALAHVRNWRGFGFVSFTAAFWKSLDYFNKIERFWCQVDPRTTPSWHWNGVLGAQMLPSWSWTGVLGAQMAPRWHWNGGLGAQMAPSWHWNGVLGDQMAPSWPWTGVLGAQIAKRLSAFFPRPEAKTGNLWIDIYVYIDVIFDHFDHMIPATQICVWLMSKTMVSVSWSFTRPEIRVLRQVTSA